jgi:hypothetical protein
MSCVAPYLDLTAAQGAQRFGALTAYPNCRGGGSAGVAEAHDHWELPIDLEWVTTSIGILSSLQAGGPKINSKIN